ncbi:MAG TPA: PHP domain-containing protein [Candidatus Eremiobacteraeota bacterium]|nr:MAG: histidinol-phosphatase [bacterium ADurb.Bin363]HPZ10623.1 PHP domain-containing protein [Candidatus Eremiobacteraeota bacterium]
MRVDIHCHTSKYSGCSEQSPEEMAQMAIKRGLNAIVITEHYYTWEKEELTELQKKYPDILILNGVEITVRNYYNSSRYDTHDILVYGLPETYRPDWKIRIEEVLDRFEPAGCAFVLAHPFRFCHKMLIPEDILKKFHALEIDSSNFNSQDTELSLALAKKLNIPSIIASDSHSTRSTGIWYIETMEFNNMQEFLKILKSGNWTYSLRRTISD